MDQLHENDPVQEAHAAVVIAWRDALGISTTVRVQQIIERASLIQELRNVLIMVAEDRRRPGFVSHERLGRWLKKMNGKVSDGGLRIVHVGISDGYSLWSLVA